MLLTSCTYLTIIAKGGSTFCGVGALTLLNKQTEGFINREKLILWCLNQQTTGFAGRVNKEADACYCFWIGAALDVSTPAVETKKMLLEFCVN